MSDAVARSIEFARKTHRYISRDEHYVRRRRADPPLSLTRKAPNSAMIHYARQSNLIPKSPALTPQTPDQLNCPTWTNDSAIAPTAFPSVASHLTNPERVMLLHNDCGQGPWGIISAPAPFCRVDGRLRHILSIECYFRILRGRSMFLFLSPLLQSIGQLLSVSLLPIDSYLIT
jgi:hypothetical protein